MTDAEATFHVLLVEDDADTAKLLARYLEAHGIRVSRASDGGQAWRIFQQEPPDLLLTDLMLPWMGGAELIRLVRGHARGGRLPVVVATASVNDPQRAEALRVTLGAQAVLPKPTSLRDMLTVVRRCWDDARAADAAGHDGHRPLRVAPVDTGPALPAPLLAAAMGGPGAPLEDDSGIERADNHVVSLCHTLLRLRHARLSALLVVRDSRGLWQLVLEDGVLVGAASSDPAMSLPATLMEDCALNAQQTGQAARLMIKARRTFPSAAAEVMGAQPWVVAAAMERHLRRVAWRALGAQDGNHTVLPWAVDSFLRSEFLVDPVDVVQDLALGPLPDALVEPALAQLETRPWPDPTLLQARLAQLEARVLRQSGILEVSAPEPRQSVPQWLARLSGEGRRQALALLLSSLTDPDLDAEDALMDVGTTLQDGVDWNAEGVAPEVIAARNVVAQGVLDASGCDAYALLGVDRVTHGAELAAASLRWQATWMSPALDAVDLGPARAPLQKLRSRLMAATEVLNRDAERRLYDTSLPRTGLVRSTSVTLPPVVPPPPSVEDANDVVSLDTEDLVLESPRTPAPVPAPPPPARSSVEAPRGPRLGHHLLRERMAVGGAAEVFMAENADTGERVVLKRLRPDRELDLPAVTGFIRECDLAVKLTHPCVVRGRERGMHQGLPYLVMELVDGMDLERALRRAEQRKVEVPRGVWTYVLAQMLDGLEHLHQVRGEDGLLLGLVHRDLAPRNVLLSRSGDVKLADFGACVFTQTELPPTEVVGSAGYLSPEQARLELLDARSDLFAVGCMLYRVASGQAAFDLDGRNDAEVLERHRQGRLRPLPRAVPRDLALLVESACAPDREDRPDSAAELARALRAARAALGETQGREALAGALKALAD